MGNQWGDATLALGMTKYLKLIYGFSTANVIIFYLFYRLDLSISTDIFITASLFLAFDLRDIYKVRARH
jgi:hypothetical protein